MRSAIDKSQDSIKILSSLDLDEVLESVAETVLQLASPQAVAILMWDRDLENFSDQPVFGPRKKEFRKFVESLAADYERSDKQIEELDVDAVGVNLPAELTPVFCYRLFEGEDLCAVILIAGADDLVASELQEDLAEYPLRPALAHAWEHRELRRENERLRAQYEELEDRVNTMEEQTRKVIHDTMSKEALRTSKIERERLVYGISNAVRSSLRIQEVLQNAVNQIGSGFAVSRCFLVRPVDSEEQLVAFEYHNPQQEPVKALFAGESGMAFTRLAMASQAPQVLGDPQADGAGHYEPGFLKELGLKSGLVVPLILRERTLGVIFLLESTAGREWSIDDTALLGSLADQLSVAIENAELHEERERQAVTDGLTGVANRRHFNETFLREFERARRYGETLSLIVVDLDYLKKINDTYGHQAGDGAIKAIARVMQQSSRSIDLAARYGGEEFCLLLPNTDLEMAEQIAERLRRRISECTIEGPGSVTASVGVASYPDHAEDADNLFQQADEALYEAKQHGRNRVCIASKAAPVQGSD